MWFIGDVHGMFSKYLNLIHNKNIDCSLQIGDMGVGFGNCSKKDIIYGIMNDKLQHKFIRGNHDNPLVAKEYKNYLGDYGYIDKINMFYLAGGYSIDRVYRIKDVDWWDNEELSYSELDTAIQLYNKHKPKVVISHEAPTIAKLMIPKQFRFEKGISSRTEMALQTMYENHRPDLWIFGHYHIRMTQKIHNTEFICLAEMIDGHPDNCCVEIKDIKW